MTVTVKTPATKPSPSDGVYVEADVTQPVPTYFMRALGMTTVNVSTTAIAGYAPTPNCIYIKDPNDDSKTLTASGSSDIVADCGILDESTNSDGMDVSGGSTVAASSIGLVSSTSSGVSASNVTCGGSTANCPQVGVASSPDPLAYLDSEEPTPGACAPGTSRKAGYKQSSSPATISPGTYCNGITVPGGDTLNLNPGLYILTDSGGLTVSGGSKINGTGVTFYNTGTGQINITGGTTVATLSAPSDTSNGGIPSILFFQDPNNTAKATISGGSKDSPPGRALFPCNSDADIFGRDFDQPSKRDSRCMASNNQRRQRLCQCAGLLTRRRATDHNQQALPIAMRFQREKAKRPRRWSYRKGQSAVELAVVVPVLALLLVVVADFGRVFFVSVAVNNAARAGAQYGSGEAPERGQFSRDGTGSLDRFRLRRFRRRDLPQLSQLEHAHRNTVHL